MFSGLESLLYGQVAPGLLEPLLARIGQLCGAAACGPTDTQHRFWENERLHSSTSEADRTCTLRIKALSSGAGGPEIRSLGHVGLPEASKSRLTNILPVLQSELVDDVSYAQMPLLLTRISYTFRKSIVREGFLFHYTAKLFVKIYQLSTSSDESAAPVCAAAPWIVEACAQIQPDESITEAEGKVIAFAALFDDLVKMVKLDAKTFCP